MLFLMELVGKMGTQVNNIVAVVSRCLKNHELNWSIREKELFSIVYAVKKFEYYIDGREDTIVKTDHKSLIYLTTNELKGRIARWAMALMPFNLIVQYISGSANSLADSFTRLNTYFEQSLAMNETMGERSMNISGILKIHKQVNHCGSEKLYHYLRQRNHKPTKRQCSAAIAQCEECLKSKKNSKTTWNSQELDYVLM
eukprot:NODE_47_length_32105_cov_1.240892.p21 type:complete len:199 gc:universal NODE_47_length_32105_cov_1.240892:1491-895(-)